MIIRAFQPKDAAALAELFHESVRRAGIRDYSPRQVEAWSPAPVPAQAFLARVSDGRCLFVAVTPQDTPLGFIELEPDGHIDCFYCHPDHLGQGIGALLYVRAEDRARATGVQMLHVEASESARHFFRRQGFQEIGRRDFLRHGVAIHNYRMEKPL